jgi:hypothetical protein
MICNRILSTVEARRTQINSEGGKLKPTNHNIQTSHTVHEAFLLEPFRNCSADYLLPLLQQQKKLLRSLLASEYAEAAASTTNLLDHFEPKLNQLSVPKRSPFLSRD